MGAPDHPFYRHSSYHPHRNEMHAQYHAPSSSSMDARYYNSGSGGGGGGTSFSSSSSTYRTAPRSESSTSSKKTPRRSNESLHLGKRRDHDSNIGSSNSNTSSRMDLPRPQAVKRDTSHQNETAETKTQVKRLNRQPSIGH